MVAEESGPDRVWRVAEAKARLSEILRLAEEEGPQRIGRRKPFVVVPERLWRERSAPAPAASRMPLGRWLVENMPRGTNLEIPPRARVEPADPLRRLGRGRAGRSLSGWRPLTRE